MDSGVRQAADVERILTEALTTNEWRISGQDPDGALEVTAATDRSQVCVESRVTWWDETKPSNLRRACVRLETDAFGRTISLGAETLRATIASPIVKELTTWANDRWSLHVIRRGSRALIETGNRNISYRVTRDAAQGEDSIRCIGRASRVVVTDGACSLEAGSDHPELDFTHSKELMRYARWSASGKTIDILEVVPDKRAALELVLDKEPPGTPISLLCTQSEADSLHIEVQAEGATVNPPAVDGKEAWSGWLIPKGARGFAWATIASSKNPAQKQSVALPFELVWWRRIWGYLVGIFASGWITVEGLRKLGIWLLDRWQTRKSS